MSEVERVEGVEGAEGNEGYERAEGVAGIEGVESYCTSGRLWVYPLNTSQSALDKPSRSARLREEKHLRLCQKPKVRARWSKKCRHIEVR